MHAIKTISIVTINSKIKIQRVATVELTTDRPTWLVMDLTTAYVSFGGSFQYGLPISMTMLGVMQTRKQNEALRHSAVVWNTVLSVAAAWAATIALPADVVAVTSDASRRFRRILDTPKKQNNTPI